MAELNMDALYKAVENSRWMAFQQAQNSSKLRMQQNLQDIGTAHRNNVTQAQTAARISALGQEEKLAAAGLNGGSMYTAPTSGYTETARIAADNNLRSNLNLLSAEKLKQEQNVRNAFHTELSDLSAQYQSDMSDIQMQQIQSAIQQYNADRAYELDDKRYQLDDKRYQLEDKRYQLADKEYNMKVQSTAYQQAMQRWETYGVVLPADAGILGVAAGTRTASSAYNNAKLAADTAYQNKKLAADIAYRNQKLALDRWKALL